MKNYHSFLLEKVNKEDLDIVYNKYYTDIDFDIFKQIVESDPTSTIEGQLYLGKYSKWLLKLYKNNKLKLEDLYKVEEYIKLFDKQSVRNKIDRKDINQYKSLGDLSSIVLPFKESDEIKSDKELKEDCLVHEFKNYKLYIPKTFEDSCRLGKGTEWCTATEKTDEYYNMYHKPGRELLIFISKEDAKEKYQLHLRSKQFMDIYDVDFDLHDFLDENKDIKKWLFNNYTIELKKFFNDDHIDWDNSTLKGSPKIVEGNFRIYRNNISSLKYAPEIVEGNFNCSNQIWLTTLNGGPKEVYGNYYCDNNRLTSLEGAPKVVEGDFMCQKNNLTSLEGGPEEVQGDYYCHNNNLTSLKGAPKLVEGNFLCYDNNLTEEEIEKYRETGAVKGKIIDMIKQHGANW